MIRCFINQIKGDHSMVKRKRSDSEVQDGAQIPAKRSKIFQSFDDKVGEIPQAERYLDNLARLLQVTRAKGVPQPL